MVLHQACSQIILMGGIGGVMMSQKLKSIKYKPKKPMMSALAAFLALSPATLPPMEGALANSQLMAARPHRCPVDQVAAFSPGGV